MTTVILPKRPFESEFQWICQYPPPAFDGFNEFQIWFHQHEQEKAQYGINFRAFLKDLWSNENHLLDNEDAQKAWVESQEWTSDLKSYRHVYIEPTIEVFLERAKNENRELRTLKFLHEWLWNAYFWEHTYNSRDVVREATNRVPHNDQRAAWKYVWHTWVDKMIPKCSVFFDEQEI
jgi:hypothetical protein